MSTFSNKKINELKTKIAQSVHTINYQSLPLKYRPIVKKSPNKITLPLSHPKNALLIPVQMLIKHKSTNIKRLFEEINKIKLMNEKLLSQIGLPLAAHIRLIRIDDKKIIIFADSDSWAQRTRFIYDDILLLLNKYYDGVLEKISIQVVRLSS